MILIIFIWTWSIKWPSQKQSANTVNCWRQIEPTSILANFFTNFFVLVNSYLMCERLANVLVTDNQSKRAVFTWFICVTLQKMRDACQDECEAAIKFIEEVHNCPAVWNVSSVAFKDSKHKQKMEELADKLGFVQTFLFLHCFLFLLFSSSVTLLYVSTTALSRPCGNFCVLWFDASLTCEGTSHPTFLSLPTQVCPLKFAIEGRFKVSLTHWHPRPWAQTTPQNPDKMATKWTHTPVLKYVKILMLSLCPSAVKIHRNII